MGRSRSIQCCEAFTKKFNDQVAREELEDYRKKIIKKNSRPLIQALMNLNPAGAEILDIGGGVGVIDFELFKAGIKKAIHIEMSEAYGRAFREEAERQSLGDKVISLHGDFLTLHHQIETVDLVCLDKVICCYPNYRDLVTLSAAKASRWYAFVIPRDVWWVKVFAGLKEFFQLFSSNAFRTYIHPEADIGRLVVSAGFEKIQEQKNREWLTVIYQRV